MTVQWTTPLVHDRLIVTGAGSGIGRATAIELAKCGATAYILGRRLDALEETAAMARGLPGKLIPISCDLTSAESTDNAYRQMEADGGPVRALAHCAASVRYEPAREINFETFKAVVGTTLFTAFNAIHRWAMPLLEAELSGVAVALTSGVAHRGTPGVAHSSSGKSGIEGFVRSVAREWGPSGLRLNVVGPGVFPVEKSKEMFDRLEAEGAPVFEKVAIGRFGKLSEIVGPIMLMLSEAGGFCTGSILHVDGGARLPSGGPPKRYTTPEDPGTRP